MAQMSALDDSPYAPLSRLPTSAVFLAAKAKSTHVFGLLSPSLPPFDALPVSAPRSYDPRMAYLTTVVSAWAYSDGQTMANQLAYYGLPNCSVREFSVVNDAMLVVAAAYFVRSEDGRVGVLAFRGTMPEDFINWLTDADTTLTNFHFGMVHTGFYRNVEPLWGGIAVVIGVIVGVLVAGGAFDKAIKELTLPLEHEDIIRQQAHEKGVDAALIAAVIDTESKFTNAESSAGALGLMQITPAAAEFIEKQSGGTTFDLEDLSDPEINIRYGTFLLKELLERYEGDTAAALAGYNAGPGNADKWGGAGLSVEEIPFPETRAYVELVLERQKEYREKYGSELGYGSG